MIRCANSSCDNHCSGVAHSCRQWYVMLRKDCGFELELMPVSRPKSSMTYYNEIKASHPTRTETSGAWRAEETALLLVGERSSKRDLVDLVRWLIVDRAATVRRGME